MIRQAFHPERYGRMHSHGDSPEEIGHCIASIRESLMCNADLTPNVWQWREGVSRSVPFVDVPHRCRKWDDVQKWAWDHMTIDGFDDRTHAEY